MSEIDVPKKSREPFVPLKITARLLDGRVNSSDGLFFLDSIIYHAWFSLYTPDVFLGTQEQTEDRLHIKLPLYYSGERRRAASCGFYHVYARDVECWRKHPDFGSTMGAYVSDNVRQVDIKQGKLRAYNTPNPILVISDPVFYAIGQKSAIEQMLALIPAIGKKPAEGWGTVTRWDIEEIADDFTTVGPYGLMRPMPIDEFPDELIKSKHKYHIRECGIRPPYWKRVNQRLCYIPEVEI